MKSSKFLCLLVLLFTMGFLLATQIEGSAKWWDKLGEPKYGGTLNFRFAQLPPIFDPYEPLAAGGMLPYWYEHLFMHDWTLDRDIWSFKTTWAPTEYWTGVLIESWEWKGPKTMIGHVRKGVRYHKKPPANGREFTANDIQFHYDRMLGTGSGFDKGHPFLSGWLRALDRAVAVDKYTVRFEFKSPSPFINFMTITDVASINMIECPEVVKAGIKDFNNAVGTGPYMPSKFVAESSLTLEKNPDYWGYDERHPKNKLPYADEIKMICIPDTSAAMAALRTGKIHLLNDIDWQQAKTLKKTIRGLKESTTPAAGMAISLRCDTKPFTDINVRKALQMAINRPAIAKSYYGGTVDGKPAGMVAPMYKGWCVPYEEWPKELRGIYSFNPKQAKKMLADAGYPKGFKTNCIAASNNDLQLMQLIKSELMDIGVDMEIKVMDPMTFTHMLSDRKHDQMAVGSWCGFPRPPQIGFNDLTSKGGLNGTMNNDTYYDGLVEKLNISANEEEARKLSIEIDMYTLEHFWGIIVCPTATFHVWQPFLKGYSGEYPGWIWDWHFSRLWIDKD